MPPIVMPCNDDLRSRIFKARTSFLYVDEWRQWSGTEVTVVSKVQHQTSTFKSDSPCCTSFDILPPGRSMKAISGVLESPWAALSTRRIISLIGGDFWQIEWVKKVVTLCRARPISPPHQNCTPSVHFWPNWRYNNHSKALFKLYRLVSLLTQQIMMIVTTKISKSDLPP